MAQQIDIVANLLMKVDGAEAGINKLKSSLSKLKMPEGLENSFKKSFANLDTIFAKYRSQVEKGFDTKGDVSAFTKTSKQLDAELTRISKHFTELTGKPIDFKVKDENLINAEKELARLVEQKNKLATETKGIQLKFEDKGAAKDIETLMQAIEKAAGKTKAGNFVGGALVDLDKGNISQTITQLEQAAIAAQKLGDKKKAAFESENDTSMVAAIQKIVEELRKAEGEFSKTDTAIDGVKSDIDSIQAERIQKVGQYAEDAANSFEKERSTLSQLNGEFQEYARSSQSMSQQLGDLQQSTQYFFSLRNMLNLLKRGVDQAIDTVKELDAAMTKTAVVTDFSVGDMWTKLPEYTANANALGASVKDMYEATTLYYQQGLNTDQAMGIAAETMKMARIGGLEAADATDKMTAALRGFNMELNETSAQRVNDVYSNLAAKTASNTEELGTAMQRTASIAASAGMSFEGTAAFLAQAIETTREPAENLGTAMKTIVARFTELKKNPLEISEVDGEEVDYNKVDTALKSIGVSLKDANGQFRNLDQVFLDISQRWDSLSQTQQRYIATIAAGSRQQSRFIAMMSNYDRTVQLMDYANNSAGASNEQFGKTMESLEAKLNKLQNAWNEFLMGIANSSFIKTTVDGLTDVIDKVNKLIDTLSLGNGGLQSFLSIFAAFKGLKYAGRGINGLIGGVAGSLSSNGSFTEGFKTGFIGKGKTEITQATNQITQAIYSLVPHIDKDANANASQYRFQDPGQYNNARKELVESLGGHIGQIKKGQGTYTAGGILDIINTNQLNKQQQKQFFQSSPGLKKNLTKSLAKLYEEVGTDKKTIQSLTDGFKNGDLGLEEALMGNSKLTTSFNKRYEEIGKIGGKTAARAFWQEHYNPLYNEGIAQGLNEEEAQTYAKKTLDNKTVLNEKGQQFLQSPQVLTNSQKFANLAGQIGAGFMSAGSAVQMFGAQITQVNPAIGQAISNFGGLLTTVGSFANVIPSIIAGGPAAWGITAAVAAIGAITVGFKAHSENIKKQGQEIVDTYSEVSDELQSSIDNIKSYQAELTRLSAGVDKNGFNINLDDSDYLRYQELVDDLVQQNPAIVEGWNSEGKAIINVNKALKETIKLKQQDLDAAREEYLSDTSGQKLIRARNEEKGYKLSGSYLGSDGTAIVSDIVNKGLEDEAKAAGFDLDRIKQGDVQALNFLRDHYTLLESIYKQSGQEISETLSNQMSELDENLTAYDEAIAPLVDYLKEYANTEKLFADLPVELTNAFNEGIASIAGQDLNINEMKGLTNLLSLQLQEAFNDAKPLLDEADAALDTFAQDLNETAYNSKAGDIADQLRVMADQAEALGHTEVAQWYENQASRIEGALSNATESIADNIDTLSDNIANAKANFEALGESIDDYYSLADQAHGLVETALEEKNTEGRGSKTFWNTYRGLASEDAYNKHDREKAIADMEQFQRYFTEGAEGSRAFAQKLIDSQDDIIKGEGDLAGKRVSDFFELAEDGTMRVTDAFTNLTDEQYAQLASVFDLSADGFSAVLNKLRQFGDLDFDDPAGIRRALALDERSIKTETPVKAENGEKINRLYYGESALKSEMADLAPDKQEEIVDKLTVNGSIALPTGAENLLSAKVEGGKEGSLLAQFVKDTQGSSNQVENVMKSLIQSGEYNKDELQTIHGELIKTGGLLAGADDTDKNFEDIYNNATQSIEDPATAETNNILSGIDSTVNNIAGIIAAGKVEEGYLPDVVKQSGRLQRDLIGESGIVDSWAQQFARGKDANGNTITNQETYNEIVSQLKSIQDANKEYIQTLETGRQAAVEKYGEGSSQVNAFDEEIKAATDNASLIETYLKNAATAYENSLQQALAVSNEAGNKLHEIRDQKGLTSDQKQAQTAETLTALAGKLQDLNWSPVDIQKYFSDNFRIQLKLEGDKFATDIGQQIQDQINNLGETQINAILNISSISIATAASGQNNPSSAFRRHGTMARGSRKGYTISGRPTLTGEEGEELVWEPKRNEAYMVGSNGPQFANISKDAVVWNAEQTKRIKKNSKVGNVGTGARGIHHFGTMAGGRIGSMAGGAGTTLPGVLNLNATAIIQDVTPPTEEPTIPVKGKLEIEGNSGGALSKIKSALGGGEEKGGITEDVSINLNSAIANPEEPKQKIEAAIPKKHEASVSTSITMKSTVDAGNTKQQIQKAAANSGKGAKANVKANNSQTINVNANTSAAQAKINKLISVFNKTYTLKYKASGPHSIKVPISANFTGSWRKTVEITKGNSGAQGINNYIGHYPIPSFGSAVRGKYGTVGPKNNGGLTLTGEEGFEIAWLPSENRSMILGANGPQMLNLPKDAVVFTNEQSKKILKQKAIPAGSHNTNSANGNNIFRDLNVSKGGSGSSKSKKSKSKSKSKSKKKSKKKSTSKGDINNFSIQEVVRFNIDKKLTDLTNEIENRTKSIEKNLEKIGTRYEDIADQTKAQVVTLNNVKNQNQALLNSYQAQLSEWLGQKEKVSYTDSKGKSHDMTFNVSSYVNADGSINQAAIAKLSTREQREAVFKAVSSQAKTLTDGMNSAQKAMDDAQQKIDELGKKISEAFYQWENELTEVYDLTQRINNEVSFTDRFTSQIELELSKLGAGFGDTAQSIENTRKVLIRNNKTIKDQIKNQQQMIAARQRELRAALDYQDEVNKRQKFENKTDWGSEAEKNATVEWAKNLEQGAVLGYKYVSNIFKDIDGSIQYEIDWQKFNADNDANPYSKDTYEAIKKYLDELNDAATEFNNSIKDQTDFIKQTYDALKEYQDYVADMEDTLIKGVEEEIENAKDNAKKISDSITDALKDLLDEVKRKLDERRQQEDNAKTERDISQKQQRLAMLRADTAGGHQVEIAQLEKEIADSQQSYQRTLEDQLLDRLQQQADEAAEQRERQIELMETSNQIDASTNKELVDMWLKDPEKYKEEIKAAWLEANGYDEKGEAGQYVLENQFESDFAQLITAVEESNFKDNFNALTADTNSLVALLNELTNGQLGREDELSHDINALNDVTDRNTTSILTEVKKENSAAFMKARGVEADTLKTLGYTAKELIGDNPNEPIYSVSEMKQAGYTASEIKEGGISDVGKLKAGGFSAEDLKNADFSFADLFSNFTPQEMANIFGATDFKGNNIAYAAALQGFGDSDASLAKLRDAGYTEAGTELQRRERVRAEEAAKAAEEARKQTNRNAYNNAIAAAHKKKNVTKNSLKDAIAKGAAYGVDKTAYQVAYDLAAGDGKKGVTWKEVMTQLKALGYSGKTVKSWNSSAKSNSAFYKAFVSIYGKWSKFATGGLASYTGPAWLDGTPSKPELVLNAADTKNFLALRDVLSSAMRSTSAVTNSYGGDIMYDINIHVDKIEKDYDVDRVVDKVKKEITKGAGYRNVTQVRNFK